MKRCWCGNGDLTEYSDEYLWCKNCNSLVSKSNKVAKTENLDDDKDFYGKQYWYKLMAGRAKCSDCDELIDLYLKERAAYWLKCLYRFLLPGKFKVLEIGCGLGQLSYLLKCSGYRQTACELSPEICRLVRSKLHINIKNTAFKKTRIKYDAIIAMDLAEHLSDPAAFFRDISGSIKNDGIVLIQTPCFNENISYDELKANNPKFLWLLSPDEHLFLYSRSAITKLLEENGFGYIQFLDAYFGNDYDMFVAASKVPLKENTEAQIKNSLYANPCGRLLNALIDSSEEKRRAEAEKAEACNVMQGLVGQLETLTDAYKSLEGNRDGLSRQLKGLSEDYASLEDNRNGLLAQLKDLTKNYSDLGTNRDGLLDQLNKLTKDYADLEDNRDGLLAQLKDLTEDYRCLEEKRNAILEELRLSENSCNKQKNDTYDANNAAGKTGMES